MILANYSPDQYSAFWSGVGALATLAAAIVAAWTLVALRNDSRDRPRPVMAADLQHVVLSDSGLDLIISNTGQSIAKEVEVAFDPPLPLLVGDEAEGMITPVLQQRYATKIPTVVPGKQLRNVYFVGTKIVDGQKRNSEPVPDQFTVRFAYKDTRGRSYSDSYDLDVSVLGLESAMNPSTPTPEGKENRRLKAIEAIARAIGRH